MGRVGVFKSAAYMTRGKLKSLHIFLAAVLILSAFLPAGVSAFPVTVGNISFTEVKAVSPSGTVDLAPGDKGVSDEVYRITMSFDSAFTPVSGSSLAGIRVIANGSADETYKFDIAYSGGNLTLTLKNHNEPVPPYRLLKHSLYCIAIPANTFRKSDSSVPGGTVYNTAVNYVFVTAGDGSYPSDILKSINITDGQASLNINTDQIEFEFIDEIAMDSEVLTNPQNYINISCTPISNSADISVPYNQDTGSNSVANYNININGNKLVLKPKSGQMNDFYSYIVSLAPGAVYLRDSASGMKIYNGTVSKSFSTNQMLQATSPASGSSGAELEPVISFTFNHPIELSGALSSGSITISSDKGSHPLSLPDDITINGNVLTIYVKQLLEKNTAYTVVISPGVIRFKNDVNIVNERISISFVTTGQGQSPVIVGYSSDIYGTDDITSKSSTRLTGSGSIYVKFDRNIRLDKKYSNLKDAVSIYKIPQAYSKSYSPSGVLYDSSFVYRYSQTHGVCLPEQVSEEEFGRDGRKSLEDTANLGSKIPLSGVTIVNSNTLMITPAYPLDSLNKYKAVIDEVYIEDLYGVNMESRAEFTFWTKAASDSGTPSWAGLVGISSEKITVSTGSSGTTYTVVDVPEFGSANPIVLSVDSEVVVNAVDQTVIENLKPVNRISFDSLKNITLAEYYDSEKTVGFSEYKLEYYYSGGVKRTRIYLYPEKSMENGKKYKLTINAGTFVSRSDRSLPKLDIIMTVEGDSDTAAGRGIYSLENANILAAKIQSSGEASFKIIGYNFNKNIDNVTLTGPVTVTIPRDDIDFIDVSSILVTIRNDAAKELIKADNIGNYVVTVNFSDGISCSSTPSLLTIAALGEPEVISVFPSGTVDEKNLLQKTIDGTTRYFLRVTFRDYNSFLKLNLPSALTVLRDDCSVYVRGSGSSQIDKTFLTEIINLKDKDAEKYNAYIEAYIFNRDVNRGEAYLYIPVKALREQTTYDVTIAPGIVSYQDGRGNVEYTWSFGTMPVPAVTSVSIGTVGEDYDTDVPVIITGQNFSGSVRVFFGDEEAERVRIKTDSNGDTYIEAYLPSGRHRLKPGTYNITVENDSSHQRVLYGALSVIKAGDVIPDEEYRYKGSWKTGEVLGELKVSEDTLLLSSRYSDRGYLSLDLDELMGEDVLVRNIKIDSDTRDVIGVLETKSKWGDITLYSLRRTYWSSENEVLLKLGRVEAVTARALKSKYRDKAFKSELIQVGGSNLMFEKVVLTIPYSGISGKPLDVIRYDEDTRKWEEVAYTVDMVNRWVKVESNKPGIFAVVQ